MNETLIGPVIVVAFVGALYYFVISKKKPGNGTGTRPPRNPPNEQEK